MRFLCQATAAPSGNWTVRYDGTDLGPVEVQAATRDEAMEKMRGELRYRLELCPCTGEAYRDIRIELADSASFGGHDLPNSVSDVDLPYSRRV